MGEPTIRFDGNGNYVRGEDALWRYTDGRDLVPGGRDLLLADLFPAAEERYDGRKVRRVPRVWLRHRSDHPLAWVTASSAATARDGATAPVIVATDDAVFVSASVWLRHARQVVGMMAPELHPWALVGLADVATMTGIAEPTLRAYLARRQMPEPVTRVGRAPVWSRPIIERWLAGRRDGARGGSRG